MSNFHFSRGSALFLIEFFSLHFSFCSARYPFDFTLLFHNLLPHFLSAFTKRTWDAFEHSLEEPNTMPFYIMCMLKCVMQSGRRGWLGGEIFSHVERKIGKINLYRCESQRESECEWEGMSGEVKESNNKRFVMARIFSFLFFVTQLIFSDEIPTMSPNVIQHKYPNIMAQHYSFNTQRESARSRRKKISRKFISYTSHAFTTNTEVGNDFFHSFTLFAAHFSPDHTLLSQFVIYSCYSLGHIQH